MLSVSMGSVPNDTSDTTSPLTCTKAAEPDGTSTVCKAGGAGGGFYRRVFPIDLVLGEPPGDPGPLLPGGGAPLGGVVVGVGVQPSLRRVLHGGLES